MHSRSLNSQTLSSVPEQGPLASPFGQVSGQMYSTYGIRQNPQVSQPKIGCLIAFSSFSSARPPSGILFSAEKTGLSTAAPTESSSNSARSIVSSTLVLRSSCSDAVTPTIAGNSLKLAGSGSSSPKRYSPLRGPNVAGRRSGKG